MQADDESVVRLLAEGGSIEVFGHQKPNGLWSFAGWGTNLELYDDGDERVSVFGLPRCEDLGEVLPDSWVRYRPMVIHPALRGWFRERYSAAVASLPEASRERHAEHLHRRWQAMLEPM
jgi:hypothetical protein